MSGRRRSLIWWSLRMFRGGRFDGEHAAGEGDGCVRNTLAGQTVSVLADNGATTAQRSSQSRTGRWRSQSPARRRSQCSHCNHQQQYSESERDIFADVRTAKIADLVVIKDGSERTVRRRTRYGRGSPMRSVMHCRTDGQRVGGQRRNDCPDGVTEPDGTVEISVTSQTAGVSQSLQPSTAVARVRT